MKAHANVQLNIPHKDNIFHAVFYCSQECGMPWRHLN